MGEINVKELKVAIGEVNGLVGKDDYEDISSVRTVGIKKEKMALLFIDAVESINKIDPEILSDETVDIFNDLPNKDELNKALGEKPTAGKGKGKGKSTGKEKAKGGGEKKTPAKKELSRYGHLPGAKSGKLDDALYEGGTMKEIMDALDIPRGRFNSHVKHLRDDLGLTITIKKNKEDSMQDHYKVKEEKVTK